MPTRRNNTDSFSPSGVLCASGGLSWSFPVPGVAPGAFFRGEIMAEYTIMDADGMRRTFQRLAHEIDERDPGADLVLVGIRRGGEYVAGRVRQALSELLGKDIPCGSVDIGMQRDDLVSAFFLPDYTENRLDFSVDGKTVVLCDDVLHTGRTVRAAIETVFRLGRPRAIRLLELIDRGGRELPVRADFVGKNVPTSRSEYVKVYFAEREGTEDKAVVGKKEG